MLTYNLFAALILISVLAPIAGAIALLFTLSFEREMDILKIENKKVKLEKELQQSEYMQLNQQIQPHFLFNSMNVLLSLARLQKIDYLIETMEHLTMFLRFKYQIHEQLIPVKMELDYTKHYLAIQRVRFGERLSVSINVAHQEAGTALIPPYLVQTLVENAFKHGIEKKVGPVHLNISVSIIYEDKILLEVIDNGIGLKDRTLDMKKSKGHGLKNIDRRLDLLFEGKYQFLIESHKIGGTKVKVIWPLTREVEVNT
ncbi:sensor histidine kinase [Virgibacillus byunsanensis]|uniref:Sensor histidine kinase n=1 Tax=Virgibacillus byunsanensis TaxID=570945 RepID=A0ABW3LFX6_9BACI